MQFNMRPCGCVYTHTHMATCTYACMNLHTAHVMHMYLTTDLPTKNFQNLEIGFGFYQKLGVFISKQGDWSRKQSFDQLNRCSTVLIYIKGLNKDKFLPEEISSYKFNESLCGFFDAILKMISPSKFSIRCKQKPDSKPITDNG